MGKINITLLIWAGGISNFYTDIPGVYLLPVLMILVYYRLSLTDFVVIFYDILIFNRIMSANYCNLKTLIHV